MACNSNWFCRLVKNLLFLAGALSQTGALALSRTVNPEQSDAWRFEPIRCAGISMGVN